MPGTKQHPSPSGPKGSALIWIIVIMVAFSALGASLAKNFSTNAFTPVDSNLTTRSEMLAESGYRFLAGEYFNASDDPDRNRVLDDVNGDSFDISSSGGGSFTLNISSYFYRLTANPNGGSQVRARFVASQGTASIPSSGRIALGDDGTTYQYTSATVAGDVITFNLATGVTAPSTPVYSSVVPVVSTNIASTITEGGNLSLSSGQGTIFPPKNGVFWVDNKAYRYKYKSGDTLVSLSPASGTSFTNIPSGAGTLIRLNRHITVTSRGRLGGRGSATFSYQVPLDSSTDMLGQEPETVVAEVADLYPDTDGLGTFREVDVDGGNALQATGSRLADDMTLGDAMDTFIDAVKTIRDAIHSNLLRFGWNILIALLELAQDVLEFFNVLGNDLDLPDDIGRPKAYTFYDWGQAGFDMVGYWRGNSHTLSYDVQTKIAIIPDRRHYNLGVFLRNDNSVTNGGETLAVSIQRGDTSFSDATGAGDGIPGAIVPNNRTGAEPPIVVIWAQKDLDGDGQITPGWMAYNIITSLIPFRREDVEIWPEERIWLAWAELPSSYCFLNSVNARYFADWLTLMVRVTEKDMTKNTANFVIGNRVNEIKVFLATPSLCGTGGSTTASAAANLMLDKNRNANPRGDDADPDINWPVFDAANLTAANDNYSLVGGAAVGQLRWTLNGSIPASWGFDVELDGATADKDLSAIIRTDLYTTENYDDSGSAPNYGFPEELGLHSMGDNDGDDYFDDFAVRFKGNDSSSGTGTGFFPPAMN